MRPGRRLAARHALAAVLVTAAAGEVLRDWDADAEQDSATCNPQGDIFKLVLEEHESDYIVDASPQVTLKSDDQLEHLPRGCKKWVGKATCCTEKLYEMVEFEWLEEAEQIAAIRDVYTHLIPDAITPAVEELASKSQEDLAEQFTEVAGVIEEGRLGQAVAAFIDGCEDPIRLHFASTTCELCNPDVSSKLLEGKYLQVDAGACHNLYTPCTKAMSILELVAGKLATATMKLKAIVDAGVKSEKVAHAYSWISGASHQMTATTKRLAWYKDEPEFCKRLQDKGYMYDPKDWGDLDQLHPGMATKAFQVEASEKQEEVALVKRGSVESRGTQCVNGFLRGNDCFCQPCWTGVYCEKPASKGPMELQPFRPLVADNVMGSQHSFPVVGCQMPKDLNAQLARVKFLKVKRAGFNGKATLLAKEEDPCPLRDPAEGSFQELPLQVPVSASDVRLEYLVQVPQGSEGLYAVCYCYGSECLTEKEGWWRVGHVKVVRTKAQANEEEQVEVTKAATDPHSMVVSKAIGPPQPPPCDMQWKQMPIPSIVHQMAGKDKVSFECAKGYTDLQGVRGMACINGNWEAEIEEKEGLATPWDRQLPRCRWGKRGCKSPADDGHITGGGTVSVEDGEATYSCPFDSTLLVDPTYLKLSPDDMVARKAGNTLGTVLTVTNVSGTLHYEVVWKVETLDASVQTATVEGKDMWLVLREGKFHRSCQEDGSWAPWVDQFRCLTKQEANLKKKDLEMSGMGGEGAKPLVSMTVPMVVHNSLDVSSHGMGPCGGTFGVPEVRRGEAYTLIQTMLPQQPGQRPETASFLELKQAQEPEDWTIELLEENATSAPAPRPTATFGITAKASLLEIHTPTRAEAPESRALMQDLEGSGASMLELGGQAEPAAAREPQATVGEPAAPAAAVHIAGMHVPVSVLGRGGRRLKLRKWPVILTTDEARGFKVDKCWTTRECSQLGEVPPDMAAGQKVEAPKQETQQARTNRTDLAMVVLCILGVLVASAFFRTVWLSIGASGVGKRTDRQAGGVSALSKAD